MKKLILFTIVLLLTACGGTSGTTSTSSGATATDTVNCASGSICPPSQINVISPKTN